MVDHILNTNYRSYYSKLFIVVISPISVDVIKLLTTHYDFISAGIVKVEMTIVMVM